MIVTNIAAYKHAGNTLKSIGVGFNFTTSDLYTICEHNPEYVITNQRVEKVSNEYPHIKFISPYGEFPNYKLNLAYGFDSLELLSVSGNKIDSAECCFINDSVKNKTFVQKLISKYSCHIYGVGFGIKEVKKKIVSTTSVYSQYEKCACNSYSESLKILALGKECITCEDLQYCNNIYKKDYEFTERQIDYAMNNTFYDVFYNIFKDCDYEISEKLKSKKEEIHATSVYTEC